MNQKTSTKDSTVLDLPWITKPKEFTPVTKEYIYGQSKSGAHEWQGKKTKWHEKSFSAIARRYSKQADAVEAGRDPEMDDALFLAV